VINPVDEFTARKGIEQLTVLNAVVPSAAAKWPDAIPINKIRYLNGFCMIMLLK
jgi:hypothetical protein